LHLSRFDPSRLGPLEIGNEIGYPMAKSSTSYVCQNCGAVTPRWSGRCDACGGWNTIIEERGTAGSGRPGPGAGARKGKRLDLTTLNEAGPEPPRLQSGLNEFDRVCGGGLVPGSALLVGGDPGIGKSTLLLQVAAAVAARGEQVLYISGEEAVAQLQLRARRLALSAAPVRSVAETNLADILATLRAEAQTRLVVIDSIQTLWSETLESAPGTVAQVRWAAQELIAHAKNSGATVILVGHVTKEGQLAGPRVIEHMVDTVLHFEGERSGPFRILRTVKNRFGPTDEIGVFEMGSGGLAEVANPSLLFLGDREKRASGTAVFAGIEGTRPLLVEIQALVAPSVLGTPRRAVVGWDGGRLAMILAVLEARGALVLGGYDVYLNVAGGLRISEPAADLAVVSALVSAALNRPLQPDQVIFGEISLSGAIRPVTQPELRLKEAAKLGFKQALTPVYGGPSVNGLTVTTVDDMKQLLTELGATEINPRPGRHRTA
jgi:DNA repair protein RadA/Sms